MNRIENVSLSPVKTAITNFLGSTVKRIVPYNKENTNQTSGGTGDGFNYSDSTPLPSDKRTKNAIVKSNEANKERLTAETNRSGEIDSVYEKLLPEYNAYKNPDFNDLEFTRVSDDTLSAAYKKKSFDITCKTLENGNRLQEIKFNDGSHIKYEIFAQGGKMKINGEEFEMPAGTIVETKSANDRVFSQLIQTPDMERNVINKPQYLDKAEQILTEADIPIPTPVSETAVMPTPQYMLNLLGKTNISYITKNPALLEKSIAEGKLPPNTSVTGENEAGNKILTIPADNCKYEVCDSEMRVIDNTGETKMIARYESARESQGLWVISYDEGKPVNGSHYATWNLDVPVSTVNYSYDDNTVTATTTDAHGNKSSIKQPLAAGFCLNINKGLKFVSSDNSHLGKIFENQKPLN